MVYYNIMVDKRDIIREIFDLARHFSVMPKGNKLTIVQLRTLVFIDSMGIVKPTEIAKEFLITPATITSQIDILVNDGWLERSYNTSDRRVIEISLTEWGKKELEIEREKYMEFYQSTLDILSLEEQESLLIMLKKIHNNSSFEDLQ